MLRAAGLEGSGFLVLGCAVSKSSTVISVPEDKVATTLRS